MKGYKTREVAELLDLEPSAIREIARAGVLSAEHDAGQHYRFSFQDIIVLRTAKELIGSGIPRARVNQALYRLKSSLPATRPLTSLRISGAGSEVVIHENERMVNPESGQMHFDFAIADLAGTVAPLARKAARDAEETDELTSDDWYDLGVDLEAVSPADAPSAYERALEIDPMHSDAHVNLGRLLQESGDFERSESHYRQALVSEPDNVLAAFNLGTLLEDLGRIREAIDAYQRAPRFADAHYNLSRLYELVGEHTEALKHLKTYRSLIDQP